MTSGPSRYAEAAPAPGPDLLDTGGPGRPWPWLAVAALVVAALVWWNVGGTDTESPTLGVVPSHPSPSPEVTLDVVATPDRAEFLTYADEQTGFLVQWACSEFTPQGNCPRQLLATEDGGESWDVRGRLPEAARYLDRFVVVSPTVLAFVGDFLPSTMAVSYDAGRTFSMRALDRGADLPAPPGTPVVNDAPPPGNVGYGLDLSWIDVENQSLHRLPNQPEADGLANVRPSARPADGDLVVSAIGLTAAHVWFSPDGGRTWRASRLEVPPVAQHAIAAVNVLAAGAGLAYTFVRVNDSTGLVQVHGFRTDDGGATWTDTDFEDQTLWPPGGVVAGELICTNNPGEVFLSTQGGQNWESGGQLPAPAYLSQTVPGGPVLATLVGQNGLQTYYQSTDGRVWTLVPVPPPVR